MKKILLSLLVSLSFLPAFAGDGTRVVIIGDSITDGNWGCVSNVRKTSAERSSTDMNHIYGHSYMAFIATYYEERWPAKDYQFFNRGFSGHKLCDLEARWKEDVLDLHPDVLSVLIGTNDVHSYLDAHKDAGLDVEAWKATYRKLLGQVREQNPSVKLVLCTPFTAKQGWVGKTPEYPLREQMTQELAAAVRELCKEFDAVCVPFDDMFRKLIAKQPRESYWIWDGIHPTPVGHRRMAELWIRKVGRL